MAQLKAPTARYRIERGLGGGGGGEVSLATDTVLGREVALKSLHGGDYDSLIGEARILASLHHPNIVQVFDLARVKGELFLVLEYVSGRTLRELLAEDGPLPPAQATAYVADVARALAYAHREGIVHNDVKPDNIIIDSTGVARLTDFGVASVGSRTLLPGEAESIAGSLPYIAPELIQGVPPGPRSDIYSLAVTLYELVTGELPYAAAGGASLAQRLAGPPPGLHQTPRLWHGLAGLLERALSPSPAQRPEDADAFADELERLPRRNAWPAAVVAGPALVTATETSPPRHRRAVAGGIAATAALAVAGVAMAMSRGGSGAAKSTETPTPAAEAVATAPTSTPVPPTAAAQPAPPKANNVAPTSPPPKGKGNGKRKD